MSLRLFRLIKSMTRSEKIHFTKQYSSKDQTLYLSLYKAYQKADDYDKILIEKGIKKKWPNNDIRQASIYLETAVINTLTSITSSNDLSAAIVQTEKEFKLFRKKGMGDEFYKSAIRMVDLYRDTPMQLHFVVYLMQTSFLNVVYNKADENDPHFVELQNSINEMPGYFKAYLFYMKAYRFYFKYSDQIHVHEQVIKEIKNDIKEIDALTNEVKLVSSLIFLYEALFMYRTTLKQFSLACEPLLENIRLFEENEKYANQNSSQMFASYVNLLVIIENYEKKENILKRIKQKIKKADGIAKEHNMLFFACDLISLKIFESNLDLKGQKALLEELEELYKKEKFPFAPVFEAYLLSLFASINYQYEQYEKSLDWIECYMKGPYSQFRLDILVQMKFLTILNHIALGNDLMLPYYIKHTYRFLSKNNYLNSQEAWILSSIKKVNKYGFRKEQIMQLLTDYESRIAKREFEEFAIIDIEVWLKSQIEEESYLNTIYRQKKLGVLQ